MIFRGIRAQPANGRFAILNGRRKSVTRRKTICDRGCDSRAGRVSDRAHHNHCAFPPESLRRGGSRPASKEELLNFFEHLEEELVRNGFLRNRESRPSMVRNLRSLFQRAQCTEQELRTLHGVVTAFAGPRERKEEVSFSEHGE